MPTFLSRRRKQRVGERAQHALPVHPAGSAGALGAADRELAFLLLRGAQLRLGAL